MFFTNCTVQIVKIMLSCVFFAQIYKLNIVFFYNFAPRKKNSFEILAKIREFYYNSQTDRPAHKQLIKLINRTFHKRKINRQDVYKDTPLRLHVDYFLHFQTNNKQHEQN